MCLRVMLESNDYDADSAYREHEAQAHRGGKFFCFQNYLPCALTRILGAKFIYLF